jgi:hypothetical protein
MLRAMPVARLMGLSMTGILYPDTPCPACGQAHSLYCRNATRHPLRAAHRYTCPATGVAVVFHPTATPQPVLVPPAGAIPLTWVAD